MEGNKQYILPALAALVLVGLLVLRSQGDLGETSTPTEATPSASPVPAPAPKGSKAAIREAVAAAGTPSLGEAAIDAAQAGLAPVVQRCRASRPEAASLPIAVDVDVLTARDVGAFVERAEVGGDLPADLLGCVREGMLSAKPGDLGHTGRLSATLEYGPR